MDQPHIELRFMSSCCDDYVIKINLVLVQKNIHTLNRNLCTDEKRCPANPLLPIYDYFLHRSGGLAKL